MWVSGFCRNIQSLKDWKSRIGNPQEVCICHIIQRNRQEIYSILTPWRHNFESITLETGFCLTKLSSCYSSPFFFLFRPNSHCLRAFPNIIFVPHSFPNTICHKNLMTLWHLSKRNFSTFAFYLFHNPLAIQTEALREIEKDGMMMIKYIWFLNDWHCCIFSTKRVISVDIPVKSVKFHFYQFQFLPKSNMMCIVQDWTWRTKVWKLSQSRLTLWSLGKSSIKQQGRLCLGSGEHLNVTSNNLFIVSD